MTDVEAALDANKQSLHQLNTQQIDALILEGVIQGEVEDLVKHLSKHEGKDFK